MRKILLFTLLIIGIKPVMAQFSVRIVVTDVATKKNDDIYLTGTFNNWNLKDENYKLKPFAGGRKSIVLKDVATGNYAFKLSRGNQDKIECMADGRDITDRVLEVTSDISIEVTVAGWKDDYPERPKRYSASPQVKIIDTAFNIPQLNRTRRIWIYLPKGYATSSKTYPVLYMQDGQNLFNDQTAEVGEWGVDECLDTLEKKLDRECIVIGIDNGGKNKMSEYCPYEFSTKGAFATPDAKGEGKEYVEFLVKNLKPYIDGKYRTKKGREYTYIAGGAMGGLISEYAILQYPDVFGAAGIFSPNFSISSAIYTEAVQAVTPHLPRFYFYAGGKESASMVSDVEKMYDILTKKRNYEVERELNPLGEQKVKFWQQAFPHFYTWLMGKD